MKRPPWMSRGLWFATRRNRRGRPITLRMFDEVLRHVQRLRRVDLTERGITMIDDAEREAAGLLLAGWRP